MLSILIVPETLTHSHLFGFREMRRDFLVKLGHFASKILIKVVEFILFLNKM